MKNFVKNISLVALIQFCLLPLLSLANSPEMCFNPNLPKNKVINPMRSPQETPADQKSVGYSCLVPSVETRPGKNEGYKGNQFVKWTLVKKEGDRQIWAAFTEKWGYIVVGAIEKGTYRLLPAKQVCRKQEVITLNGVTGSVDMSLPEIGFGNSELNNPLNFELLKYLGFGSVVPFKGQKFLWSSTKNFGPLIGQYHHSAWPYDTTAERNKYDGGITLDYGVICVGLVK